MISLDLILLILFICVACCFLMLCCVENEYWTEYENKDSLDSIEKNIFRDVPDTETISPVSKVISDIV